MVDSTARRALIVVTHRLSRHGTIFVTILAVALDRFRRRSIGWRRCQRLMDGRRSRHGGERPFAVVERLRQLQRWFEWIERRIEQRRILGRRWRRRVVTAHMRN